MAATWHDFRRRVDDVIGDDLRREREAGERVRRDVLGPLGRSVAELCEAGHIGRAWLFGSFAWGTPNEQSDVDVLVEGVQDHDRVSEVLEKACKRMVHLVDFERADESLRRRVLAKGVLL